MKKIITYKQFKNEVEIKADEMNSNIATLVEMDDEDTAEEGNNAWIHKAIRVDFRPEDEDFIKSAYEDYLDYSIREESFDLQDVLDKLDNPILTLHDEHDANKIDSIVAGEDKNGEADFKSPYDLSDEVIDNTVITNIYHSDELDKWCVEADLDSELFTELKNQDKEMEMEK